MKRNQSLGRLSAGLLLSAIVILLLAPSVGAQSKFKNLHGFKPGNGRGFGIYAGLVFDPTGNLYGTATAGGKHNGGVVFQLTPNTGGSWAYSVIYSFCSLANCSDGGAPLAGLIVDSAGNLYSTTYSGGANGNNGTVFKLTPSGQGSWTESVLYSFAGGQDGAGPRSNLIFDQLGNLYGTTSSQGNSGTAGTVFKLAPNQDGTWSESVLYRFCSQANCSDGSYPQAGLMFDAAGNLYGTTLEGGQNSFIGDAGTVFQLTPNNDGSWSESVLYNFCSLANCVDGFEPYSSLIFDPAGNLYGTTWEGGSTTETGTVFRLTPQGGGNWSESVIRSFVCAPTNCPNGGSPIDNLTIDVAGNLYGTTYYGGDTSLCDEGCGLVFKLTPNSGQWQETVLHRFFAHPGMHPDAGLIFDAAGNLYGTTSGDGGRIFEGSVFEITP